MGLVGETRLVHHVDLRHASDQHRQRVLGTSDLPDPPWVSPVARDTRRCTERSDRPFTSPCNAADATASCTRRPASTSRSTKTSTVCGSGSSHADPSSQNFVLDTCGNTTDPSTRRPGGRLGMKVPSVNWMPKNSASVGIGTVVAVVSGPRTVRTAAPHCRVTTISQWYAATEMKDSSATLRVCQNSWTYGEHDGRRSKLKSSAARFITPFDGRRCANSSARSSRLTAFDSGPAV